MDRTRYTYTGIGSRNAPQAALVQCSYLAGLLERLGFILRSGGAAGIDTAFEMGVKLAVNKEILRSKHSTTEAELEASHIHPRWDLCNEYARKLHGRNVQLVLGKDLQTHSSFVICWTLSPDMGGTRTGIVVAKEASIPVFNLAIPDQNSYIVEKIERMFK